MTMIIQGMHGDEKEHHFPTYRLIWLKAQFVRREERLSAIDLVALVAMSLAGIAMLAGFLLWRFPQMFNGALKIADRSMPRFIDLISNSPQLVVIIIVFIGVGVLTKDRFLAD